MQSNGGISAENEPKTRHGIAKSPDSLVEEATPTHGHSLPSPSVLDVVLLVMVCVRYKRDKGV